MRLVQVVIGPSEARALPPPLVTLWHPITTCAKAISSKVYTLPHRPISTCAKAIPPKMYAPTHALRPLGNDLVTQKPRLFVAKQRP